MVKKKKLLLRNLLKFNENIQNRKKILKFNKKKWDLLRNKTLYESNSNDIIFKSESKTKHRKVNDNRNKLIYDQTIFYTPTFYNKIYKKTFRVDLKNKQKLTFFYGDVSNIYLKKIVNKTIKYNKISQTNERPVTYLLNILRSRLDFILYRSGLGLNIPETKTLVSQGHVFVNNKSILSPSFQLKRGDCIKIGLKRVKNIQNKLFLTKPLKKTSLVPNYLHINYKTLEIIVLKDFLSSNMSNDFNFFLDINNIYYNYR